MIYFYNIILLLFFIPISVYFFVRSVKNSGRGVFYKWKERFGLWNLPESRINKKVLWFHGASLGEVRALEPLLREFKEFTTVLTVLTPSARIYAEKNRIGDFVFLAPLDFVPVVRKAVSDVKPKALILFETELWPGLIAEAKRKKVRTILINGRNSSKSFSIYKKVRFFWKNVLNNIDVLCARSKEDAARFRSLGYNRGEIIITGNIKYDRETTAPQFSRDKAGLAGTDIVLTAGSTREEEEEILLGAFVELKETFNNLKIVIAPRHLERVKDIINILRKMKIRFSLYSSGVTKPFDCLIVDTFGELVNLYSISDITFVGGSFVDKGGQNPIEPASFSKVVLFGPFMQNFQTEAKTLSDFGGGFEVKDKADLVKKVQALLFDRAFMAEAGKKAFRAVLEQKGALKRTKDIIISAIS